MPGEMLTDKPAAKVGAARPAICILPMLIALMPVCARGQAISKIPFTPARVSSMPGKNICDLEGPFTSTFGVYLDRANQHEVAYREHHEIRAVFLLSNPTLHCGLVDAAVDLTRLIREGESIEFKCYTDHEGGTTPGKWGHIVGLANNDNGLKRFVRARLAWRVNIKGKRFEKLNGQSVTCDTSGYDH